jgi:2-iminobutanoate/2-iminopropanoate deaminase
VRKRVNDAQRVNVRSGQQHPAGFKDLPKFLTLVHAIAALSGSRGSVGSAERARTWDTSDGRFGSELMQDLVHQEAKMISVFSRTSISTAVLTGLLAFSVVGQAKDYLKGDRPQQRGYSEAVITEGGRTVWLAGQTATVDDAGKSLAGDFEGQVRQLFKNLDRTLQKAGGKLSDMVQMTVFITDVRYGDRLTQIRREVFGDNFPGSALITITALAVPDAKIEIQGYAVIGSK